MNMKLGLLLVCAVLLGADGMPWPSTRKSKYNKLLLISFDGFRWNYDEDAHTPNMDQLVQEGVKAKYITPPMITMTSPSHFTTITGKNFFFFKKKARKHVENIKCHVSRNQKRKSHAFDIARKPKNIRIYC